MNWLSKEFYFSRLKRSELGEMIDFIIEENYNHSHLLNISSKCFDSEFQSLLKEDMSFFENSVYYVLRSRSNSRIYGSIKITHWDQEVTLPIQKLFGIDIVPSSISTNLWHIGRFAISNKIPYDRISILKKLLYNAFHPVHEFGSGRIFAECDEKLTKVLSKIGIDSLILGNSIQYIGSETLPICIESNWLNSFILRSSSRYHCEENNKDLSYFGNKVMCREINKIETKKLLDPASESLWAKAS